MNIKNKHRLTATPEKYYKDFPITSVCRADLEGVGFDITDVGDDTMFELSSKMANAYCDLRFWEDLEIIAENLGIKKHKRMSHI